MYQTQLITVPAPNGTADAHYELCFEPAALIGWEAQVDAPGFTNSFILSIGLAATDYTGGNVSARYDGGVNANGLTFAHHGEGSQFLIRSGAATLVGTDPDGFTLHWGAGQEGRIFHILAIGGEGVVAAGGFEEDGGPITGLPFAPDVVFAGHIRQRSWDTGGDADQANMGFGVATQTDAVAMDNIGFSGVSPTVCVSSFHSGVLLADFITDYVPTLTSDGFTITPEYPWPFVWIAIADESENPGGVAIGIGEQPSSTGEEAVTGLGIDPGSALFFGACTTVDEESLQPNAMAFIGGHDGVDQAVCWAGSLDSQAPNTVASRREEVDLAIIHATPSGPATQAEASVVGYDSGEVILDWAAADATARLFAVVAFEVVDGNPCPAPAEVSFDQLAISSP